jgi:diguanylate cyclase (GGDEF)-like protein/PAS domain S-box-containing protein
LDKGNVIRPLIFEESSNDAETLANALRNVGYAVRYKYVEDDEDIQTALNDENWDILLAAAQVGDHTAQQAITLIKQSGKDIPAIVFGPEWNSEIVTAMLRAGAADYVAEDAREHLLLAIEREFSNLRERRAHRLCKNLYAESEKRNRVLLDSSRDAIAYIHEGMHIYANQSYQDLFGYPDAEELESIPIMDLIAPDDQQDFKEVLRTLSKGQTPEGDLEYKVIRDDEKEFSATMQFSPATIDGEPCTQVIIHRKGDNKELEQELQKLRQQDLLTGLYNHQHFMETLKAMVTQATQGDGNSVLLYLEPDNFKNVRDVLGVAGSDMVLTDIAQILRSVCPEPAILARYAGTTFTILVPGLQTAHAEKLAERLRLAVAEKIFEVEGKSVTTTISIGISGISEVTPDAKKPLSQAESACNIAKNKNGNQSHIYSEEDELASLEADKKMLSMLRLALKNDRFSLQFQPIVSLHAEPGERYEVLLRMLDQDDNIIMPGEFLEAAEHGDLMTEIDRWVIKNTAKALLNKRKLGKEIQFFIKLAGSSLRDPSLLTWLSKLLQAARLHGSSLVFEISEQAAIENLSATKTFANGLKQLNCHFALDHVASESESLDYLKHFNINFIKIDGSHILNINNEDSQEVIQTIADLGREQGFQTIAEHVQDPACLAVLWQHGVNFIQGHYLQKPEDNMNYDFSSGG